MKTPTKTEMMDALLYTRGFLAGMEHAGLADEETLLTAALCLLAVLSAEGISARDFLPDLEALETRLKQAPAQAQARAAADYQRQFDAAKGLVPRSAKTPKA